MSRRIQVRHAMSADGTTHNRVRANPASEAMIGCYIERLEKIIRDNNWIKKLKLLEKFCPTSEESVWEI
ncbi:MAG: hypothetical protein OXC02_11570 [Rhodobacteraceae bacterium]|nr:hypothetical protein [Paracoccaceae bacterium]